MSPLFWFLVATIILYWYTASKTITHQFDEHIIYPTFSWIIWYESPSHSLILVHVPQSSDFREYLLFYIVFCDIPFWTKTVYHILQKKLFPLPMKRIVYLETKNIRTWKWVLFLAEKCLQNSRGKIICLDLKKRTWAALTGRGAIIKEWYILWGGIWKKEDGIYTNLGQQKTKNTAYCTH